MNSNQEFDKIISKMSEDTPTEKSPMKIGALFGATAAAVVVSFIGGVLLMLGNRIINDAYPNMNDFRPGIGYISACQIFFLGFCLISIFMGMVNSSRKS